MNKFKNMRIAVLAVFAASALALTSCANDVNRESDSGGADGPVVGFIANHLDSYYLNVERGVKEGVQEMGGTVITISIDDDAGKEAQAFQDLISRQVDYIAVSPFDSEGSVAGVRSAVDAGIPVICFNECVSENVRDGLASAFVLSDNTDLGVSTGTYAAKYINKNLEGKAKIGILNCDLFEACKLRKSGFLDTLKEAGVEYQVLADQTEYVHDKTTATAEAMLTANPEMNVMWSATDGGASGEISAIGSSGQAVVFSTDMSLALGENLLQGDVLKATTAQDGAAQGKAIVEAIRQRVKPGEKADPFITLIPGILYSVDDSDAVKEWMEKNKN